MNRRTALVLAVLAVFSLVAAAPAARAAQWQLAEESKIQHKASVALFSDEKNGITAGYAGAVYVTHDGGKTWTPATNSSACRFGLEAVPGAAFTSGNQGHVRVSTDGGEHWTGVASFGGTEPSHARFLSFADARRGLIASPSVLGFTQDGGATWTQLALPKAAGAIAALSPSEEGGALRLRLLDENGYLFESRDAGKTWAEAKSPLQKPVFESMTTAWAAMRFRGAEGVLVAFVDEGSPRARAYRTRDGGKTWAEEALPAGLKLGAPSLSFDGKLLTLRDAEAVRVYRAN